MTAPCPACTGDTTRIGGYGNREVSCEVCEGTGEASGGDALRAALEAALCAPDWAASLGHIHDAIVAIPPPTESVKAPEGWVLMPRVPTTDMLEASAIEWTGLCSGYPPEDGHYKFMRALWAAMLAAAPASPITADDAAQDESTITDADIDAAVRHGFGNATADALTTDDAVAKERERAEAEANGWERGMRDAANICASLAETVYDDSDAFEAATGCEAAIVSDLRSHQRIRSSETATDAAKPEGGA